jgi:hypothetical protein
VVVVVLLLLLVLVCRTKSPSAAFVCAFFHMCDQCHKLCVKTALLLLLLVAATFARCRLHVGKQQ